MKIKSFEFNLRELAGSMGDFGTLFPLAIGYIVINGLNPAGFLVMMGLANIISGLVYRLPMPIQPMKVLAVMAIAQHWSPSLIYASGVAMGIVWILLTVTNVMNIIARITPKSVIRGIQASLGILLAVEALKMVATSWVLGVISVLIVLFLRQNRYAPAALVLMSLGTGIAFFRGDLAGIGAISLTLPKMASFQWNQVWEALVLAGFAQIPLTATNAVIATSSLINDHWPEKKVTPKHLAFNMGVMNLVFPLFGGMPMCHGAGGLAGQYYFGARTGGANIIEGVIEIALGLFLATSIVQIFGAFPLAIIGSMMFLAGLQLTKFVRNVRLDRELVPLAGTILVSLVSNMAFGFLAGIALHYALEFNGRNSKTGDTQSDRQYLKQ